jgi:photosystem II stability/assembly factor-like uncharacterized protein
LFAALLLFYLGLAGCFTPVHARPVGQTEVYRENFEDGEAQGWDLGSGWTVQPDGDNTVLVGQGHVIAGPALQYDDFTLALRVKAVQGNTLFNYRTYNATRYLIDFQPERTVLSKQTGEQTFLEAVATAEIPHRTGQWHQVEISGQAGTLQFKVDGRTEWTYTDPDPLLAGGFTFEPIGDSLVYFDDVTVTLASTSAFVPGAGSGGLTWVRTGGPLGGLGYDVRMRPDALDRLLVTDANAGVFLSSDGGVTWAPSNEGITTRSGTTGDIIPIFCLTIDPTDPDRVWAGTQGIRGIFKSTDGGRTWKKRDRGIVEDNGITFRGFTVDPKNPDVVFAAAELSSFVWNGGQERAGREFDLTAGVVYRTGDGGANWTAVWRGDDLARYIWIDPRDSNIIYVSTGIFDREAKNSDSTAGSPGGEGVLKSTDGGQTWTRINNGLNNLYVGSLFMHPTNPDVLLAGVGNNAYPDGQGVYLTQDGGANWKQVLSGEIITAVEFSTGNPSIAYAAGPVSVYRSSDGGATWARVSGSPEATWGAPGIRAGFPIDLQVDPRNPDRLFANAYGGGNFLSEDGGKTWTDASRGYTGAQVRGLAVDPTQPGRVLAAARSGLFLSNDGGATWAGLGYPPVSMTEWNAVALDPADPTHRVSGSNQDQVLVNGGPDGSERVFDLQGQRVGWKTIVFASSNPAVVYAGSAGYYSAGSFNTTQPGAGVFRSEDGGRTWSAANDALTANAFVNALAVDPRDPNVVYAATADRGLLKTGDGGQTWQAPGSSLGSGLGSPLPEKGASAVSLRPGHPDVIFAGFERRALFISTDGGQTWSASAKGMMPESSIVSIVFDPTGAQETVYAADSTTGVYRSLNAGQTWERINQGLTNRAVNALAISNDGLHLYAASEGGGVFRLDLNGEAPPPAETAAVQSAATVTKEPAPESTGPASTLGTTAAPSESGSQSPLPCAGALALPAVVLAAGALRRRS